WNRVGGDGRDSPGFAPPAQAPISELRGRRGSDALEGTARCHGCLEAKLRGVARLDLLNRRDSPGLVVDDRQLAVLQAVDSVGLGAKREGPAAGKLNCELSPGLGRAADDLRAARCLLSDEPACDALEARPPKSANRGTVEGRTKGAAPELEEPRFVVAGAPLRRGFHEGFER